MNIFVVTVEKDVFIVDEGLSPSLAKRTVKRYNEMFSAELSGVTYKDSPTTLKFIHWSVKPRGLARGYKRLKLMLNYFLILVNIFLSDRVAPESRLVFDF